MNPPSSPRISISEEVREAMCDGHPIVALESNVISHGLPYPANIETACAVEGAVRSSGSTPATLYVDKGQLHVGMSNGVMERFATDRTIPKVSSRDLAVHLARGNSGATTVASSVVIADLAGIPFFASAGIGGVHRGAASTMDISSDLIQFTRSKVAVVCAGAKNILDLGLTLEYMETQNIPVISYGTDDFPAFYCSSSGYPSPHRIDDLNLLSRAIRTHWDLGNDTGIVIAAPPNREDAVDQTEVELAIQNAVQEASKRGIAGNAVTKFLMHAVDKATFGKSAKANSAVLISTARLGGQIAAEYAQSLKVLKETM